MSQEMPLRLQKYLYKEIDKTPSARSNKKPNRAILTATRRNKQSITPYKEDNLASRSRSRGHTIQNRAAHMVATPTVAPKLVPANYLTGFVIVRNIRDKRTSQYWFKSYECIRKIYPQIPIVIIDDNSNPMYVDAHIEKTLLNCEIIKSEFPGCGEILGYYYYLKHRWFPKAVIIHDSVFLQNPIHFDMYEKVRFLWHFEGHHCPDVELEPELLKDIGEPYLELYQGRNTWKGCFGVMAVIDHEFLTQLEPMFDVIHKITTRRHRSCMERIFAVMCFYHYPDLIHTEVSILGDIHRHHNPFQYSFENYISQEKQLVSYGFVKVWTGR